MSISPGFRLGHYKILAPLGAGAMGEVFRATDTRLDREVAIKVLQARFTADTERLRRFDTEARTAGSIQHPNLVAIFDVGQQDDMPYVVTELLKGDTLRDRLEGGALPLRKVTEYGTQIARGLAAAHARGIIHRDLKPENLFVTTDGTVKILDFGLAKLMQGETTSADSLSGTMTQSGMILGTVGYMSPEQARGLPAGPASDVFALGCVLYEMLTGARAFHRETSMDTMTAILREDPPAFPARVRTEAPGLAALVLRCLEKEPGERFESARDVVHAIAIAAATAEEVSRTTGDPAEAPVSTSPTFRRLTFRRGRIHCARFSPDGHSVVYGAAWEGQPVETFWMHLGGTEGRSLGPPGTDLLAVAQNGEMAISLKRRSRTTFSYAGTLARMPMGGGSPRQILQHVDEADWNPTATALAIVREAGDSLQIEYPIGKVVFRTSGWISHMRVSRDGKLVAFIHHELAGNDAGSVTVVDMEGNARVLSGGWGTARGLAWSADGREVMFCAHEEGAGRNLHAVSLEGTHRVVHQVPGQLCIQDVLPDGRALLTHSTERMAIVVQTADSTLERDLSWLDWSLLRDITPDGQWVLISESGEGGGPYGSVCLRMTDGSPPVVLGQGEPMQFSPAGQWVLAMMRDTPTGRWLLLPTGVGEARELDLKGLRGIRGRFTPDGSAVIVAGRFGDAPGQLHRFDLATGELAPIPGTSGASVNFEISPDGQWIALRIGTSPMSLIPIGGGEIRPIPGLRPEDELQPWIMEQKAVLVAAIGTPPTRIDRIDLETGERTPFREIMPPDTSGVFGLRGFRFMPDGKTFGYTFGVQLDELYLVENLR